MGTAGGDDPNDERYLGVAPAARLVDVRVAGSDGQTNTVDLLDALDWCIAHVDHDWDNDGEENDGIDFLTGATRNNDPAVPWNMMSDPETDPDVDTGKLGEYGSLITSSPPARRMIIDCRDGGKHWEVSGN